MGQWSKPFKGPTVTTVQFDNFDVELSQPLRDRPDVVLIKASDGRRTILGDGYDPFTADEYRQMDSQPNKEIDEQDNL